MKSLLFAENRFILKFGKPSPDEYVSQEKIDAINDMEELIAQQLDRTTKEERHMLRYEMEIADATQWLLQNRERHEDASKQLEEGKIDDAQYEILISMEDPKDACRWLRENASRYFWANLLLNENAITQKKHDEFLSRDDIEEVVSEINDIEGARREALKQLEGGYITKEQYDELTKPVTDSEYLVSWLEDNLESKKRMSKKQDEESADKLLG